MLSSLARAASGTRWLAVWGGDVSADNRADQGAPECLAHGTLYGQAACICLSWYAVVSVNRFDSNSCLSRIARLRIRGGCRI